ncbi:MAG: MFS transporter [Rhodobacteraceae bacterium]|nr:MFS transporter [Paracoccaceae bacterium]
MRMFDFLFLNKRWLLAGGLISLSSSYGQTFFISIFAGEIMAEFGLSDGQWGGYYSAGTTASAIVMLWGGILSDRFRAGTLAAIVLVGLAIACLFMANLPGAWALPLAIFALRFTGQGMLSHIAVVAIARWFQAARGKALAISTLGFSVGEAFLPMLFVFLLAFAEWRSLWLIAALASVLMIPVLLILLQRERTPQSIAEQDSSAGMNGIHWTRHQALSHWLFWMILPTMSAPGIFSTALFFQQVHLSTGKGWEHAHFVALFPLFTVTTIASMFAYGWAIDRFGCAKLIAWFQVPMALAYVVFGLGDTIAAAMLGFVLMGLMQGGGATLFGAFWPEFYGTRNLGAVKSLATSLMVLGSALGPGLTGALIDLGYPFADQMVFFAVYILAACTLTHLAMRRAAPLLPNAAA